jgi:hypothetical protein
MRDMVDSWVRLHKRTETAIDHDEREIGRFLFQFTSKKCMDIETICRAEKVGVRCFHYMDAFRASSLDVS